MTLYTTVVDNIRLISHYLNYMLWIMHTIKLNNKYQDQGPYNFTVYHPEEGFEFLGPLTQKCITVARICKK